ncbi:DUF2231 domain-containing protein [Kosakonia sacchari]|uniref:DUF2231 domain-containing protein n=1 Tax=Kosakonia sacchari TaxID=1158459 RepID=A0A1G4XJI6_9ENTR|nr:DUF2231 domain-containing protein [Kosakonia sacchari]SCX41379.1 hypothetical protein SAMN02927897_01024 [Kosakonia sacchari]
MQTLSGPSRATLALYELFNPLPTGFFVAAWIFDILYIKTFQIMWTDAASWLIAIGLLIAIIPRLIHLVQVFVTQRHRTSGAEKFHFWLWLVAIVLAIFNAFVPAGCVTRPGCNGSLKAVRYGRSSTNATKLAPIWCRTI